MSNDLDTMKPVIAASIQPEQMDRHAIMSRALRHGFTLRPQEGRDDDLNEYVYSFAREVFEAGRKAASIEKKGVNQFQLRIILRAVQEFEISVGRAAECIEMLEAGRFSVADLPEVSEAFGFDDAPMEKYAELRAERDALAAKLAELEGKVSDDISPEFTDNARSALMWVLWHHQGGSSPVGQPIRYALGMGRHDPMNEIQVQEAKRWAALTRSESHDFHKRHARPIPAEPVNARLLEFAQEWLARQGTDENYMTAKARAILAEAEAQGVTGPKRLTDEEIETAARMHGTGGWQTLADMMTFARAIEAAVLGAQETKSGD